ncbi:MAG TPA: hypothetical protein PKC84_01085 [Paracoccaceae bacterium]|nr:hypothetical protein [Paracoccaceae bacterium]
MYPFPTPALMLQMAIRSQLLALDWQRRTMVLALDMATAGLRPPAPAAAAPAAEAAPRPARARRAAGA